MDFMHRYLALGLSEGPQRVRRMRLVLNVFSLGATILAAIYAISFLILDAAALWPAALVMCLCMLQILNPVVALRNEGAGMLFGVLNACIVFILMTWLLGRQAGFFLFILQAPLVVLLFAGSFRPILLAGITMLSLASILYAMLSFPTSAPFIEIDPRLQDILAATVVTGSMAFITGTGYLSQRRAETAEIALEAEHERAQRLLYAMLPERIADLLKSEPDRIVAEDVADATVVFADLAGFTKIAARRSPASVVAVLEQVFASFDDLIGRHGLEKIKTLGDGYLVTSGVVKPRNDHAEAAADFSIALLSACGDLAARTGEPLQIRIGLHSGPLVAGVIAPQRPVYDVWGSTVNVAARLEAAGMPGRILVAAPTKSRLGERYVFERKGVTQLRGLEPMETWWLQSRAE